METKIKKDEVIVCNENGINTFAYIHDGAKGWFIKEDEKTLPPEELHRKIKMTWRNGNGYYRCTGCGFEMERTDVAGWPLFAGVACSKCNQKHQEYLKEEIKKGHVCRMCGQPYGNCCC